MLCQRVNNTARVYQVGIIFGFVVRDMSCPVLDVEKCQVA